MKEIKEKTNIYVLILKTEKENKYISIYKNSEKKWLHLTGVYGDLKTCFHFCFCFFNNLCIISSIFSYL